jgi:hypothetical protein
MLDALLSVVIGLKNNAKFSIAAEHDSQPS